jgi:hypothetical protein
VVGFLQRCTRHALFRIRDHEWITAHRKITSLPDWTSLIDKWAHHRRTSDKAPGWLFRTSDRGLSIYLTASTRNRIKEATKLDNVPEKIPYLVGDKCAPLYISYLEDEKGLPKYTIMTDDQRMRHKTRMRTFTMTISHAVWEAPLGCIVPEGLDAYLASSASFESPKTLTLLLSMKDKKDLAVLNGGHGLFHVADLLLRIGQLSSTFSSGNPQICNKTRRRGFVHSQESFMCVQAGFMRSDRCL